MALTKEHLSHGTDITTKDDPTLQIPPVHGAQDLTVHHAAGDQSEDRQKVACTDHEVYAAEAGAGFEDVGQDERLIPFLRVLQALSPQCDEANGGAAFNPEARPGMIINSATGQLYSGKTGFLLVPAYRDHTYPEFVPREAGGGFVGVWPASDPRIATLKAAQGAFGKLQLESGNELTETYSLYGLFAPMAEDGQPPRDLEVIHGLIGFTSTQIKTYKMVITRLDSVIGRPPRFPIFAHAWHVRTVGQKNKKGSFYGWQIGLLGGGVATAFLKASEPLVQEARAFHAVLKAGAARADYESGGGVKADDVTDDEAIPF